MPKKQEIMIIDTEFLTQEDYIRTQNKCTRKNTVRNTRKGMIVDKKKVKNALIASCMLGAIASGITITAGSNLITTFEQNSAFATECRDFQGNVINPNTHRTADKIHV